MKIEFLSGIWIIDKLDTNFIENKNISNIINLEKDLEFLGKSKEYNDTIKENIEKYEILKLVNYLKEITYYIKKAQFKSENIAIISKDYNQKSSLIILAYLIRYGFLKKEIAIQMIRTKILEAFKPTIEYDTSINIFLKQIKK
jgi:hypothetical protein